MKRVLLVVDRLEQAVQIEAGCETQAAHQIEVVGGAHIEAAHVFRKLGVVIGVAGNFRRIEEPHAHIELGLGLRSGQKQRSNDSGACE